MESSLAPRVAALSDRPLLRSRLVRWPRKLFIAAEYDDLAACRITGVDTAGIHNAAITRGDVSTVWEDSRGRVGWQLSESSNSAELTVSDDESSLPWGGDVLSANEEWIRRLSTPGRAYDEAVGQLHELLLRAAGHQMSRMREADVLGAARRDEIIHSAADEATVSVLSKVSSFEGRSAFTTWAYKFGILQAGTEIRRAAWRDREINLDDVPEQYQTVAPSPEGYAEGRDLAQAVRDGLREALTPHQRRIALAVLIDDVPIDVLAERLSINRGALYKTLHDARQRLRAYLSAHDFLLPVAPGEGVTK